MAWVVCEHYFPDFVVLILESSLDNGRTYEQNCARWGRILSAAILRYRTDICPECDGEGCVNCDWFGEVKSIIEEPAFGKDETESMERQFLALYRRYGRVDVETISDF